MLDGWKQGDLAIAALAPALPKLRLLATRDFGAEGWREEAPTAGGEGLGFLAGEGPYEEAYGAAEAMEEVPAPEYSDRRKR